MEENRSLLNNYGVDPESSNQLQETARWSKLFAVLSLTGIVLFILVMFLSWNSMMYTLTAASPVAGAGVIMAVVLLIAFGIAAILLTFLLKAGNRIKQGILNKDQMLFNSGLGSLKNFFVMLGVITVIQAVFFVFGLIGGR